MFQRNYLFSKKFHDLIETLLESKFQIAHLSSQEDDVCVIVVVRNEGLRRVIDGLLVDRTQVGGCRVVQLHLN